MRTREIRRTANRIGRDAGHAAASWVDIDERNATKVLRGFEDGDPLIMDMFELPNLSGEWADSPTPQSLAEDLGIEAEDERMNMACSAWEDAVSSSFWDEIQRRCKLYSK